MFIGDLNGRGAFYTRALPDGRVIDVIPLVMGTVRLCISPTVDADWYDEVF